MLVLITLKPQFNEADPERYKAGFDGGVDFIATFDVVKPIHRNVCFYIQCKCHKEPLTKTAIRHTNVNRDFYFYNKSYSFIFPQTVSYTVLNELRGFFMS